jgi:phenylalanyl-tRNA synthetase beta chain
MHAFDLAKVEQGIVVRKATADEKLVLLDAQELALKADSLVIADADKALALAGIMGGDASGVSDSTSDILLEAAFFAPINIAGRARNFGLHTDSSHRFERGVDYNLPQQAIERATQLLLDIVGGKAGPVVVAESNADLPAERQVNLRRARIAKVLGFELPDAEVVDILERLGMAVSALDDGWAVGVPSYRFDVSIESDLLEELARVFGYNNLPVKPVVSDMRFKPETEAQTPVGDLRRILVSRGYQESITYSFVEPKLQHLFDPEIEPVVLQNPISADMSVMRTSLWPGLCSAMTHNTKRQCSRVRLFEVGQKFLKDGDQIHQPTCIAGLLTGAREPENWTEDGGRVDFYDLKGDVEALLALSGNPAAFRFEMATHSALHPGQTARILRGDQQIGWIGTAHPSVQKALGLAQPVYLFELLVAPVCDGVLPGFTELSKFPEVRRDLAIIIEKRFSAEEVLQSVRAVAGENLKNLLLFDVYEGKGIDLNSKSLALGLTFQHPERTFSDEDVNSVIDAVIQTLEQRFGAILRK